MDYPSGYPRRSKSETSITSNAVGSTDWQNNMNSSQQQSNKHLLGGSFDEKKQNHLDFGKIDSTKQSLSVDSMPCREGLWHSLTRSATNLLGKHLTNGPGAVLKNLSSMNTPLSVTVVSPDLYKSLQSNKDNEMVTPTKGFFDTTTWLKDATNQTVDGALPTDLYTPAILDTEERWNEYKYMYVHNIDLTKDQDGVDGGSRGDREKIFEQHFDVVDVKKDLDNSPNFGNAIHIDDEPVMLEKPESPLPQTQQQQQQQQQPQTCIPTSSLVDVILTTYNKVLNDLRQHRSTSPDSTLFTKRASSPKTRLKRHHVVSVGRGRGRGRSQLRRSGVSQKRHRKESGRHAVEQDIKNDIDAWEELDYCSSNDDDDEPQNADECDFVKAPMPANVDVPQKMCTPKKCAWFEVESSSSEEEDSDDEADDCDERNSFRSRLSSCNSEDSYCIVFDEDASDGTSEDEELDSESESEAECGSKKVRFNLVPTVHRMIAWKFAYKAARRNQDLINQEHFRARIARTGRALDPVLNPQFRDRIYHERFEE